MKVLLINPPMVFTERSVWKGFGKSMPTLGLGYLASSLERQGIEVRITDLQCFTGDQETFRQEILAFNPDFVGITASTPQAFGAMSIGRLIKEWFPDVKLAYGGPHVSIMPDEVLSHDFVDYAFRGESENVFYKLVLGEKEGNVDGLSYRSNGKIIHNPLPAPIQNLDDLPFPAWHLLPIKRYNPTMGFYRRLPAMGVITSRGCPGKCTFCSTKIMGNRLRFRSAENIIEEIKILTIDYKIKEISFFDDTFTAKKENIVKFCETIIREKIDITWGCYSRVDFVNLGILKLMRRAGCHVIGYGIESGDENILKDIRKHNKLDRIRKAISDTKRAGISMLCGFILGHRLDTPETMLKTYKFAKELAPDFAMFNIMCPLPGTEIFEWAQKEDRLRTTDWRYYDFSLPLLKYDSITNRDILRCYKKFWRGYYLNPTYVMKRICKIRAWVDIRNNFLAGKSVFDLSKNKKSWTNLPPELSKPC